MTTVDEILRHYFSGAPEATLEDATARLSDLMTSKVRQAMEWSRRYAIKQIEAERRWNGEV